MNATVNSRDEDVAAVAAALADAAHAGGLSDSYYRSADDALKRIENRLAELELAVIFGREASDGGES